MAHVCSTPSSAYVYIWLHPVSQYSLHKTVHLASLTYALALLRLSCSQHSEGYRSIRVCIECNDDSYRASFCTPPPAATLVRALATPVLYCDGRSFANTGKKINRPRTRTLCCVGKCQMLPNLSPTALCDP
ncbi:hypothetical protein CBL_06264 [Carabus blaptoides fortunei]